MKVRHRHADGEPRAVHTGDTDTGDTEPTVCMIYDGVASVGVLIVRCSHATLTPIQ